MTKIQDNVFNSEENKHSNIQEIDDLLSSGQSILLYVLSEVIAHIRFDSLLVFDEPETHLHPNAISQLVNSIYELANEFESFCILATHSPLIVREVLSKNVLVFDRESEVLNIRKLDIETFGANLNDITENVFGNRDIPKQYKKILQSLVDDGYSFTKIKDLLESDDIPLSLNAQIYLKSILK